MNPESFAEHFHILAEAPNGIKKLREMILQLAVQGKLVPQNPQEEPASVLLKKIGAEKEKLFKEGKISKQKPLSPLNPDEVPYELPKGWEWVRLSEIFFSISPGQKKVKTKDVNKTGKYPVVDQGQSYIAGYVDDSEKLIQIPGPVVVFGDHTRAFKLVDFDFVVGADGTKILRPVLLNEEYFYWSLRSYTLEDRGYGRHYKILKGQLFPLPPLAEQKPIVAKVEQLMALCDELEIRQQKRTQKRIILNISCLNALTSADEDSVQNAWQSISDNFDLLYDYPENVCTLRETILQLSVQGKLVRQNPNDEPASMLLKKIKVEKEKLINEGKIRKQNPLPPFDPSKVPCDLPDGWEWTTLAMIGEINPRNDVPDDFEVAFTPMPLISDKYGVYPTFESRHWQEVKKGFTHFAEGDVVLAKITPCFQNGKSGVIRGIPNEIGAGTTELHVFRPIAGMTVPQFVWIYFKSPQFLQEGEVLMTGTAGQKRVPKSYFSGHPFPFPPLAEQKRIVTRVDNLMSLCDELEAKLEYSLSTAKTLISAVVNELIAA